MANKAHDINVIRDLLSAAFMDSRDLRRFCQSQPEFRPVLQLVNEGAGFQDHVDVLVGYCETRLLFDELLAGIKHVNPRQYARFAPRLGDTAPIVDSKEPSRYDSTPPKADDISVSYDRPEVQSPSPGPQRMAPQSAPPVKVSPDDSDKAGTSGSRRAVLLLAGIILGGLLGAFLGVVIARPIGLSPTMLLLIGVILGGLLGAWLSSKLARNTRR